MIFFLSPAVSDSKKKRQPDLAKNSNLIEQGRTPTKGMTDSVSLPQYTV